MAVTDVVDVVAMEIHVAAPGAILDEDAFRLDDGVEARGRDRLAQEVTRIFVEDGAGVLVEGPRLPRRAAARQVGVALRLANGRRDWRERALKGHCCAALVGTDEIATSTNSVTATSTMVTAEPWNTSPRSVRPKMPTGMVTHPGG